MHRIFDIAQRHFPDVFGKNKRVETPAVTPEELLNVKTFSDVIKGLVSRKDRATLLKILAVQRQQSSEEEMTSISIPILETTDTSIEILIETELEMPKGLRLIKTSKDKTSGQKTQSIYFQEVALADFHGELGVFGKPGAAFSRFYPDLSRLNRATRVLALTNFAGNIEKPPRSFEEHLLTDPDLSPIKDGTVQPISLEQLLTPSHAVVATP